MIETQFGIIRTERSLEMFTTSYDYLVYVIPYLVVAPLYFDGKLQLGSITQASEAFYYVRSDFSIIVNYFEKISAFSAGIDRLSTFIHRINEGGWHSGSRVTDVLNENKGSLSDLTRSLASNPGGYSKVNNDDDIDDNSKVLNNMNNVPRISSIILMTGPMIKKSSAGHINIDNNKTSKNLILNCENLSVLTPDGYRTLIGGLTGPSTGVIHEEQGINIQKGVNFKIYEGDKVLVVGPSGTGKSSLLRAIAGLWELGSGKIIWTSGLNEPIHAAGDSRFEKAEAPEGVFFLPQKPYNLLGSLRQQIAYPDVFPGDEEESSLEHLAQQQKNKKFKKKGNNNNNSKKNEDDDDEGDGDKDEDNIKKKKKHDFTNSNGDILIGDAELLEILRIVRLETLASRMGSGDEKLGLGVHKDWTKVLSLGEQQRLAFARVLYNRRNISVVVLDEATSALDEIAESAMYSLLSQLNITFISVGHRPALYNYHTKKLVLSGPGNDIECVTICPPNP